MPRFKKRRRSHRSGKRRPMRKRRASARKKFGQSFFKVRYIASLTTDVAGRAIHTVSDMNPTAVWDGAGTVEDWTNMKGLYEMYRVAAVKLHFIPSYPNDTSVNTFYAPMYIVHDVDDNTAIVNRAEALGYEKMRIKNLYRPWTFFTRCPRNRTTGKAINMVSNFLQMGVTDNMGGIKIFAENLDLSGTYGDVIITYYIMVRERR